MTREEAITFIDELKVCINEHPIVADWLVEIADRKTENCSEIPNNCETCANSGSYKCSKCDGEMYFKDEPQTERSE